MEGEIEAASLDAFSRSSLVCVYIAVFLGSYLSRISHCVSLSAPCNFSFFF